MKYNNAKEKLKLFFDSSTEDICVVSGEWGVGKTTLVKDVVNDVEEVKIISLLGLTQDHLIKYMIKEDYSFVDDLKIPMFANLSFSFERNDLKVGVDADVSNVAASVKMRKKIRDYNKIKAFVFDDCESYKEDQDLLIRLAQSMAAQDKKVILVYNNSKVNFQRLEEKLKPTLIVLSEPDLSKYKMMLEKVTDKNELNHLQNLRIINKIFKVYSEITANTKGSNRTYLLNKIQDHFSIIYLSFDKTNKKLFNHLKQKEIDKKFGSLIVSGPSNKQKEEEEKEYIWKLSVDDFLNERINLWSDLEMIVKCIYGDKTISDILNLNMNKKTNFLFFDKPLFNYIDKILNDPHMEIEPEKILEFKVNKDSAKIGFGISQRIIMYWELAFTFGRNSEHVAIKSFDYLTRNLFSNGKDLDYIEAFRSKESFLKFLEEKMRIRYLTTANFLASNDLLTFGNFVDELLIPRIFNIGNSYFKNNKVVIPVKDIVWYYNNANWDYYGRNTSETFREKFIEWVQSDELAKFILLQTKLVKKDFWPIHHKFNFLNSFVSSWDKEQIEIVKKSLKNSVTQIGMKNEVVLKMISHLFVDQSNNT